MEEASVKILGSNQVQSSAKQLSCSPQVRTTDTEL